MYWKAVIIRTRRWWLFDADDDLSLLIPDGDELTLVRRVLFFPRLVIKTRLSYPDWEYNYQRRRVSYLFSPPLIIHMIIWSFFTENLFPTDSHLQRRESNKVMKVKIILQSIVTSSTQLSLLFLVMVFKTLEGVFSHRICRTLLCCRSF
jgi:hypothetical protein